MIDWTKGTTLDEAAERELLDLLRSGEDIAVTISFRPSDPRFMRWGVIVGDTGKASLGSTFAMAWAGRHEVNEPH